jgi:hypothetical protein
MADVETYEEDNVIIKNYWVRLPVDTIEELQEYIRKVNKKRPFKLSQHEIVNDAILAYIKRK